VEPRLAGHEHASDLRARRERERYGKTKAYVIDAANTHVDIPVSYSSEAPKAAPAAPATSKPAGAGSHPRPSPPSPAGTGIPGAPTQLKATSKGAVLELTFTAPDDGGSPLTSYTAAAAKLKATASDKPLTVQGDKTSLSITGCVPGYPLHGCGRGHEPEGSHGPCGHGGGDLCEVDARCARPSILSPDLSATLCRFNR